MERQRLSPFLTAKEVSQEYHIGLNRIRAAIRTGELKSYRPNSKLYLVDPQDVERWIRRHPSEGPYRAPGAREEAPQ